MTSLTAEDPIINLVPQAGSQGDRVALSIFALVGCTRRSLECFCVSSAAVDRTRSVHL